VDASDAFNCFYRASAALWLGGDANIALRETNDALAVMPEERTCGSFALGRSLRSAILRVLAPRSDRSCR
jgi:hypothetical protein